MASTIKAYVDDVMNKYGIENYEELSDIIAFSGFALDYPGDYEEGVDELVQDIYDIPAAFCMVVEYASMFIKEALPDFNTDKWDTYYNTALELSRKPCENIGNMYGVSPVAFIGTADEPEQIYVNGVPVDEKPAYDNPFYFREAIERAIEKYKMSKGKG